MKKDTNKSPTAAKLRHLAKGWLGSNKQYRALFDCAGDAIFIHDTKGRILATNTAACKQYGYTRSELTSMTAGLMIIPEKRIHYQKRLARMIKQGFLKFETVHQRKDGTTLQIEVHSRRITRNGQAVIMSICRDITERKQAEQMLAEAAEDKFKSLFDHASDGIVLADPENKNFYIGNNAFCRMFGYSLEEIAKLGVMDIHPEKDLPYVIEQFEAQVRGDFTLTRNMPVLRKDGSVFYTDINTTVITVAGKKYIAGFFRDVTERKQAEEKIRKLNENLEERVQYRTTELARVNQELETLIRIASHDLRSPLVNIQGFGQLLNKACDAIFRTLADTPLPDETRQALLTSHEKAEKAIRFINAGVEKMNGLISGLLRLSQLGRMPLVFQPLDMNALLQTVVEAMEFQIRAANAEVTVDALPECRADAMLINQVFSNLLDNAIKYRDSIRPLRIRVWGRHPGWDRREDACAMYCVEDNGRGVAPEYQQKIWNLFYRLDPQRSGAGEGIGLTAVQRIVERHSGKAWMESEIGKGSRFFLALPAARKETES